MSPPGFLASAPRIEPPPPPPAFWLGDAIAGGNGMPAALQGEIAQTTLRAMLRNVAATTALPDAAQGLPAGAMALASASVTAADTTAGSAAGNVGRAVSAVGRAAVTGVGAAVTVALWSSPTGGVPITAEIEERPGVRVYSYDDVAVPKVQVRLADGWADLGVPATPNGNGSYTVDLDAVDRALLERGLIPTLVRVPAQVDDTALRAGGAVQWLARELSGFDADPEAGKPHILWTPIHEPGARAGLEEMTPAPPDESTIISDPIPEEQMLEGWLEQFIPPWIDRLLILENRPDWPFTRPTGERGGAPTGPSELVRNRNDEEHVTGVVRENEAARMIADRGYRLRHNPQDRRDGWPIELTQEQLRDLGLRETADPDFLIEGQVFDCYTPRKNSIETVWNGISEKVEVERQTERVVVHLGETTVTRAELEAFLQERPIPRLREVITIDQEGRIGHAFPLRR